MKTKHFILLTTALITFTAQCMNKEKQLILLNNDKISLTIQDIKNKRDRFIAEIDTYWQTTNRIYYRMAQDPYQSYTYKKVSMPPLIDWPCDKLKVLQNWTYLVVYKDKVNPYGMLGAATLDYPKKTRQQKWSITQILINIGGHQPTDAEKEFALLEQWEPFETCIPNIMTFHYFLHNNDILEFHLIPRDVINYITLLTFNLEKPLF